MGSWQERIKQALNEEKREITRKADIKRQAMEERLHAFQEKQLQEQLIKEAQHQDSFKIFQKLQIQELLEEVKQDVWHVGSVKFEYNSLYLEFNYESAELDKIGWENAGIEGGGYAIYGDKGHIVIKQTSLGTDVAWLKDGPHLRIIDSEKCIKPFHPYVEDNLGGIFLRDFKNPNAHQWIEELFLESCVKRTKDNCLPLDLKRQGREMINSLVPWHKRVFRIT